MKYHGFGVGYKTSPKLLKLPEKYVCHQVLFEGVEKYGLNREKIRDAFWAGESFDTVVGPAKFDMKNLYLDAPGACYLCQWQGEEIPKVIRSLDRASATWIPKPARP
jgi:hypothetical protein